MERPPVSRTIPILALVGVNALWGMSFPLMKSLNQQIDHHFGVTSEAASLSLRISSASWMIGIRFSLAFLILILFCRNLIRNSRSMEWRAGAWIAVFFYVGLVLQVVGLASIPASRSGFLTSLTAVFTPILSALFWRKIPSLSVGLGVLLALLGVGILTEVIVWSESGLRIAQDAMQVWRLGDTLTTLGALFFTGQVLAIDRFSKQMNSAAMTPGMFLSLVLFGFLTFLVFAPITLESCSEGWIGLLTKPSFFLLLLFLGTFCSFLSFLGMNKYQPYVTAVQASIIYSLEPVFASSWALVIPGWIAALTGLLYENEKWSAPLIVGGGLILLANVVALWPTKGAATAEDDSIEETLQEIA